jgi:transglutaminase-like putative cysteine protease
VRFAIHYRSEYVYETPVSDQHNAVRVRPAETPTQRLDSYDVAVTPRARLFTHRDYFGTEVSEFNVWDSHDTMLIEARARVTTSAPAPPTEAGFDALLDSSYTAWVEEYLVTGGPEEARNGRVEELVGGVTSDSPLATLLSVCQLIPGRFEYRPGVTYVGSTVDDLLDAGAGVCQDFAHLALIMLRRRGIAARYVSGYLFTAHDGDQDSAEVDTHAWVEALLPAAGPAGEHAWVGADPTNGGLTGEQHVKIGHGRHYSDVAPIKGVYRGSPSTKLDVRVKMSRLD